MVEYFNSRFPPFRFKYFYENHKISLGSSNGTYGENFVVDEEFSWCTRANFEDLY